MDTTDAYTPFLDWLGVTNARPLPLSLCATYRARYRETDIVLKLPRHHDAEHHSEFTCVCHLRTEARALRDLAGIPGIPALVRLWEPEPSPSRDELAARVGYRDADRVVALAREYLDGTPLSDAPVVPPQADWVALVTMITRIHERGYCGLDLRSRNILLGRDGALRLFDFGTAMHRDGLRKHEFSGLCAVDLRAALEIFDAEH